MLSKSPIDKILFLTKRSAGSMLCAALLLLPSLLAAQELNPLESDPRAAGAGGALFRAQCATCHGADAKGIETIDAPDLTLLWSNISVSDESVFNTIRTGVPGSIMPPHGFPDAEVWMLVSYLKSVSTASLSDSFSGTVERGESLFRENCSNCHRVAGSGGSLGPDLTRISARRSKASLSKSIREPSETIVRRYQPVTLITADNERLQGLIKSEDAFSIQIMEMQAQRLRGFVKADLREIVRETASLMTAFTEATLDESQLEDLLTYLNSTR